ncbi:MAG TPA: hypothetical protein VGD77_12510 [Gemmatimonadaceae bacterium]
MFKIAPPMAFTLMYRGVPRGIVRMHPIAVPQRPGMTAFSDLLTLSGWLEPNADYADVRVELDAKGREVRGWSDPDPEMIQERFQYWHQFYASNGLGLFEENGEQVPCETIDILDDASSERTLKLPSVMISATIRQPSDTAGAGAEE